MARFLLTEKGPGHTKLIYNGFAYTSDGGSIEKRYWRCEFKSDNAKFPKCKGRAHTLANAVDGDPVFEKGDHNHLPSATKVETTEAANCIKRAAVETQEPVHKIVSIAIKTVSEVAVPDLPQLSSMKRTIRRQRKGFTNKELLSIPKLDNEICIKYQHNDSFDTNANTTSSNQDVTNAVIKTEQKEEVAILHIYFEPDAVIDEQTVALIKNIAAFFKTEQSTTGKSLMVNSLNETVAAATGVDINTINRIIGANKVNYGCHS